MPSRFMSQLKEELDWGNIFDSLSKRAAVRSTRAMMEPMSLVEELRDAVSEAYPRFKSEMNATPIRALEDLAAYEEENPIGSMQQATVGGFGALGFGAAKLAGRVWKGIEGAEKFEISDDLARYAKPSPLENVSVKQILSHPELKMNYPEIEDIPVSFVEDIQGQGSYDPSYGRIRIKAGLQDEEAKSILLHEIQHAIQELENFAKGGSPSDRLRQEYELILRRKILNPDGTRRMDVSPEVAGQVRDELDRLTFNQLSNREIYHRLAGEVEARNVQTRMHMTPEERINRGFNESFDVPSERQIIRTKSGTMAELAELFRRLQS